MRACSTAGLLCIGDYGFLPRHVALAGCRRRPLRAPPPATKGARRPTTQCARSCGAGGDLRYPVRPWGAVQGRRQIQNRVSKSGVVGDLLPVSPGQIDVERLDAKRSAQNLGERVGSHPVEFAGRGTPGDFPAGNHEEDFVRRPIPQEPANFPIHPFRPGCLRRGQQNQVSGLAQGALNRTPQRGIRTEAGLVAKNPQSIRLVPRPGEALKRRLNGCRQVHISRMTVGNKSVVAQALSPK